MCMDIRNTLERLCVHLNMADTNMSASESSCDEKHEKRKRKGKWNEEIVTALIDLLEERPCLWNIFDSQYTKHEKRDSAYKEIAEKLEREVGEIKTKIDYLRAQLGREISKRLKVVKLQTNCINLRGFTGRDCSFLQIKCNQVALEIPLTLMQVQN